MSAFRFVAFLPAVSRGVETTLLIVLDEGQIAPTGRARPIHEAYQCRDRETGGSSGYHPLSWNCSGLLVPQGDHRVYACCAAGREVAGREAGKGHDRYHAAQGYWIVRGN